VRWWLIALPGRLGESQKWIIAVAFTIDIAIVVDG
jgi:hypothetical protein